MVARLVLLLLLLAIPRGALGHGQPCQNLQPDITPNLQLYRPKHLACDWWSQNNYTIDRIDLYACFPGIRCSVNLTTETTGTLPLARLTDSATAGQVLCSGGAGGDPAWGSCGGGGGAPTTASFVTRTSEASLSNEQSLGALTTGLLLNTVSGGSGTLSPYGGTSCGAGTAIRVLNASGAATTCEPISGGAAHTMLSATHTDSDPTSGSVQVGDVLVGGTGPKWRRLAGNTTTTKKFFAQTGTGAASQLPTWEVIAAGDLPTGFVDSVADVTIPCSTGQILKKGASTWACDTDLSGGGVSPDSLNFSDFLDTMALDANTTVDLSTSNFTLNQNSTGRLHFRGLFATPAELVFDNTTVTNGLASIEGGDDGAWGGLLDLYVKLRTGGTNDWPTTKRRVGRFRGQDGRFELFGDGAVDPTVKLSDMNLRGGTQWLSLFSETDTPGGSNQLRLTPSRVAVNETDLSNNFRKKWQFGEARIAFRDPTFGEHVIMQGGVLDPAGHFSTFHVDNDNTPFFAYWGLRTNWIKSHPGMTGPQWGVFAGYGRYDQAKEVFTGGTGQYGAQTAYRLNSPSVPDPHPANSVETLTLTTESCSASSLSVCTDLGSRWVGLKCSGAADERPFTGCAGVGSCTSRTNESCGTGTGSGGTGGGWQLNTTVLVQYAFEDFDDEGDLRKLQDFSTNPTDCPSCMIHGHTRPSRQKAINIPAGDANGRGYKIKAELPLMCYGGTTPTSDRCASNQAACSNDTDCPAGDFCALNMRKSCTIDSDCGGGSPAGSCSRWPTNAERAIIYASHPQTLGVTEANAGAFRQGVIPKSCTVDADCNGPTGSCASNKCTSTYLYGNQPDFFGTYEGPQPVNMNGTATTYAQVLQEKGPVWGLRAVGSLHDAALGIYNSLGLGTGVRFYNWNSKGIAEVSAEDGFGAGGQLRFTVHSRTGSNNFPTGVVHATLEPTGLLVTPAGINAAWRTMYANVGESGTLGAFGHAVTQLGNTSSTQNTADGKVIRHTTVATTGALGGWHSTNKTLTQLRWGPMFTATIRTGSSLANLWLWVGLVNGNPGNADDPGTEAVLFRYSSATDARWVAMTHDGTSSGTTDCGTSACAVATGTRYVLRIDASEAGVARFYINDVLVATRSTTLPTNTVNLGYAVLVATGENVAKELDVARVDVSTR